MTGRALVHLACGATGRADVDLSRAERLFATTSQELEVAFTWHNRGLVAFRSGDLPRALSCLDEASRRYSLQAVPMPDLSIDRCAVLLSARLPQDALRQADDAIAEFHGNGGQATKQAELLLSAAQAALAAAQPQAATFDPARQLAAPFIGWPSPRKIAGEQQQECAVELRLCVVWSDHDGAVVARKGLIEASQLLQDAGAVDHRLDQIRT